jgi:hypothetical protein
MVLMAFALAVRRPRSKIGATFLGAAVSLPFVWVSFLGAHGSGEISDITFWSIGAPTGVVLCILSAQVLRLAMKALGLIQTTR